MNPFKALFSLLTKAFNLAKEAGLTDELVQMALKYVRVAADKTIDNPSKREYVVNALVARKVSESVARIAVELAYGIWKKSEYGKIVSGDN